MQTQTEAKASQAIHLLATINRLGLKAFNAQNKQALIFLMLNDTLRVVKYNRAGLWSISNKNPDLLGLSGHTTINKQTKFVKSWSDIIRSIEDPGLSQQIPMTKWRIESEDGTSNPELPNNVLWLPILVKGNNYLGLWLERNFGQIWKEDEIEILNFLMQNYAAAWEKFDRRGLPEINIKHPLLYALIAATSLLGFIQIPLPISAPCEIVPLSPVMITAPLEGIINEIKVDPGQHVSNGEILFDYDKQQPLQELYVARNQVEVIRAELKRSNALAFRDKKALEQIGILKERLNKEKSQLELAEYRANLLDVKSPISGTVIMDKPDEWRGNPVHIGEKIMMISEPSQTKIRIWIPENDNISITETKPIKIILNVMPENTFHANLTYISTYSALDEKSVPSFLAEAQWNDVPQNIKPGLKGTAILYGENVSIFYWVLRRPWTYIRNVLAL